VESSANQTTELDPQRIDTVGKARAAFGGPLVIQMPTNKIDDLLTDGHRHFTPLQRLLHRSSQQERWTAELRALLPDTIARECRVTGLSGTTLDIVCRSAAAATKLRFMTPKLLPRLTGLQDYRQLTEIRIRVAASRG
jgi:hypothetical protein